MTERATAKRCRELLVYLAIKANVPIVAPWVRGRDGVTRYKHGFFYIDIAYGKPRLTFIYPNTGEDDISPRLPAGQMVVWLNKFGVAGLKQVWKEKKGKK